MRAKRWDTSSYRDVSTALPSGKPAADLEHRYDAGDQRVLKVARDKQGNKSHTLYVFASLELRRAGWTGAGEEADYERNQWTEVGYLFASGVRLARLAYGKTTEPAVSGEQLHVFFELGDHLGSTSVVLDKATGELVERSTYQAYGGAESDYRPERWEGFREDYKFSGKEDDSEVGLIYFGFRFLNPLLNRWVSADPLEVHAPGEADLNLYAYVSGSALKNVDPVGLDDGNPPTMGVMNDNDIVSSEDGMTHQMPEDIIIGGDPPEGMGEAKPFATSLLPTEEAPEASSRGPNFADQQVDQMRKAAADSALEFLQGSVQLGARAAETAGADALADMLSMGANAIGSLKYGSPDDPILNLSYQEHRLGSGLFYSGLTMLAPAPKIGRMRPNSNDLEVGALSFGDKAAYEVGQLTLRDSTYAGLAEAGMIGNSVNQVLKRGSFMLRQWGVSGTLARMNPANLGRTLSTGASPAAQAAKASVSPAAKGTAVTGRATVEE